MIAFILVSIIALAIGIGLLIISSKTHWEHDLLTIVAGAIAAIGASLVIAFAISVPMTIQKTNWVNKTFDKSYTVEEMFWNGDDIKSMLIGNKIRIDN